MHPLVNKVVRHKTTGHAGLAVGIDMETGADIPVLVVHIFPHQYLIANADEWVQQSAADTENVLRSLGLLQEVRKLTPEDIVWVQNTPTVITGTSLVKSFQFSIFISGGAVTLITPDEVRHQCGKTPQAKALALQWLQEHI